MAEIINMPKLGFDMAEGTLVRWLKKVGENVSKGEVLAEIETDKATVEVESSASGMVRRLVAEEGSIVPVGSPIAIVGSAEEIIQDFGNQVAGRQVMTEAGDLSVERPKSEIQKSALVMASPLARKIASENKVDLSTVKGTGPGGRIVRGDIEAALGGQQLVAGDQSLGINHPSSAAEEIRGFAETSASHRPQDGGIQGENPTLLCDPRIQNGRADGPEGTIQ